MEVLFSYSFHIILIGTILIALLTSIVGTMNVYKGQSLIGDALGHSTFLGIVLAFILFRERNPLILLIGAIIAAFVCYFLIEFSNKNSKIGADANMAIYLSGFFGLALALKSYIGGNPNFLGSSQAGLDNYIFGQASYLLKSDISLIFNAFIICMVISVIYYRDIKYYLFDREFAEMIGINTKLLDYLILFMTILVIGVGIKAVGIILISSFLIIPTISASKWSNNFIMVLILSAIFSLIAAFVGSYISTLYNGFSTGPTIIIASGIIALISFMFGKEGIYGKKRKL